MASKRGQYSSPLQQERQQRILRAAQEQLTRDGAAALTMKSVAQASNVALKTVYNIFGNRENLLVETVARVIDRLEESAAVLEPEPGIPQLLAYSDRGYQVVSDDQDFTAVTLRVLFQADRGDLAAQQIGRLHKLVRFSLLSARRKGELVDDVDIDALTDVIAANQWGLALMLDKGLLPMEALGDRVQLSHCLTLIPVCRGERRAWLERKADRIMRRRS